MRGPQEGRSPKIESLYTNPDESARSILHAAGNSLIGRQMHHLADDVLAALDPLGPGGRELAGAAPSEIDDCLADSDSPRRRFRLRSR